MTEKEAIESLQAFKFIADFENYSDRLKIAIDMAIEALKEERPHGEWIKSIDSDYHICSVCKMEMLKSAFDDFCPSCGADMREGEKK